VISATGDSSVIVDLSVSETKPLTSYGSGEDEEAGSGEEYDQYNESEDVPTSMQNDKITAAGKSYKSSAIIRKICVRWHFYTIRSNV